MKIKLNKNEFQKAISKVEGIISSREIKSQLSNILFETVENKLNITATDLDISMKTVIDCDTKTSGHVTLPAKRISQIVKSIRGAEIELSTNENYETKILDKSGTSNAKFSIRGLPKNEFPMIPDLKSSLIKIDNSTLSEMIKQTRYAIAEDDSRFVFNGLYLKNNKNILTVVATDGRRMSKIERNTDSIFPFENGIILPFKAVKEIQRILESGSESEIALLGNQLYIQNKDTSLICNLIDGQYPNYEQVIPKDSGNDALVNRENLINCIKTISVLANEQSRLIKVSLKKNKMILSSQMSEVGEADDFLSCKYEGPDVDIGFNYNFILDVIERLSDDAVNMQFNTDKSPLVINSENGFIAVIMPMKI